jgi:hypothetical protein
MTEEDDAVKGRNGGMRAWKTLRDHPLAIAIAAAPVGPRGRFQLGFGWFRSI